MTSSEHLWDGLIETMYSQYSETEIPENIREYKERLNSVEKCTDIYELAETHSFTENERNYLNSTLLDGLHKSMEKFSIFSKDMPIHIAARKGYEKAVNFFLTKKLQEEHKNKALLCASKYGHKNIVISLLENGVNPEYNNNKAIILASKYGHANIIEILANKGAYLFVRGGICFSLSSLYRKEAAFFQLAKLYNLRNSLAKSHYDFLYDAVRGGNIEIVKYLSEFGENSYSAICYTIENNRLDIINVLIEKNSIFIGYYLELAVKHNCPEIVKRFLEIGINSEGGIKEAISYNNINILEILLENRPLNITYLLHAIESRQINVVNFLIEKGIDIHAMGEVALLTCVRSGDSEILKKLINANADVRICHDLPIRIAIRQEIIEILIENGADVNALDGEPLMNSIKLNNPNAVRTLLDNGANVHIRHDEPLRTAVKISYAITEILLDHGADIHVLEDEPLRNAVYFGEIEMTRLLLERGANTHAMGGVVFHHATRSASLTQLLERYR